MEHFVIVADEDGIHYATKVTEPDANTVKQDLCAERVALTEGDDPGYAFGFAADSAWDWFDMSGQHSQVWHIVGDKVAEYFTTERA